MKTPRAARSKFRGYLGAALVALGSAVFLVDFGTLALRFRALLESSGQQFWGILPALGLAFLHTTQAFAFGQTDVFFVVRRMLVLFSALAAVAAGIALRRS